MIDDYKMIDDILVKCGRCPEFTIDEKKYHLTLNYANEKNNYHITSDSVHYYYEVKKGLKGEKICDSIIKKRNAYTKKFSELPENVQNFFIKNYHEILSCIL